MFEIFNFFGGILGYLLWALYLLVRNYGVAIIIFTIVLKVILFPTNIKQQKNMAAQAKMQAKTKELQEKYETVSEKIEDLTEESRTYEEAVEKIRNYMKKKASVPLGDA